MRRHEDRTTRMLILAIVGALSISAVIGTASAAPPADDGENRASQQLLVNLERSILDSETTTVVSDLGSGWVLVEATDDRADLETLLDALGVVWEENTIYELLGDPLFGDQWGLENTGQLGGTVDADIDAPEAWLETTGDPGQIIAVIDTGVDLDHPDLVDRIWTNPGEIAGNSIDDDANGYIDDVNGWDMLNGDPSPDDESVISHGTQVTGVAVAASNGVGIVGVAPETTVMPIRACGSSGSCPLSAIVEGIHYAIDNGAQVINLSLGSHSLDRALVDAVAAANTAGVLVIAAAGNDGTNNDIWPMYPASIDLPNVISVAATDRYDNLASFAGGGGSNYGPSTVDLAAPGKEIVTTVIGGWGEATGTSFAVPMVAGAASLVRAVRPTAGPSELKQILFDTVDVLGSLEAKTVAGGRLNVAAAATAAGYPVATAVATPSEDTLPFTVTLDATGSFDPNGSIVEYRWQLPDGSMPTDTIIEWRPPAPGIHDITLVVTDNDGNQNQDTIQVHANARPVAAASGSPTLGWSPLTVEVSGAASTDQDGVVVDWTWTSGSVVVSGETAAIPLDTVGVHRVELTVTDDFGSTGSDMFEVLVGTDFLDTTTSIFRLDIAWLSALGITKGCNPPDNDRYCPTNAVTRQQMAAFLARALDLPQTSTDYFIDDNGSIYEPDINSLAAAGITKGCNPPDNDRYCPQNTVTREQMAAFLARALDLPQTSTDYFIDDNGSVYEPDINSLAAAGITKGCNPPDNDRYCPTDAVTRQQMAAFLRRAGS